MPVKKFIQVMLLTTLIILIQMHMKIIHHGVISLGKY